MKTECLPYRSSPDGLHLQVSNVQLGDDQIDLSNCQVSGGWNLADCDRPWSELTADLTVKLNPDAHVAPESVLHPGESWDRHALIGVRLTDTTARLRKQVELAKQGDGAWSGQLRLDRGSCQGTIELCAFAVRLNSRAQDAATLAARRGEILCLSDQQNIWITKRPPIVGSSIENEWVDFAEHYPSRSDAAYLLDLSNSSAPRLCLNEGIEGLKQLLKQDGTRSRNSRVRDLAINAILGPVLLELLVAALNAGESSTEDAPPEFTYEWQAKIVSHLSSKYPGESEELVQQRWAKAAVDNDMESVIGELNYSIQKHIAIGSSVTKLVKMLAMREASEDE